MPRAREGTNILAVSLDKNVGVKYNEDFIKLPVSKSHRKFPDVKTFSTGDIICFASPLKMPDDSWHSSDETILSIDKTTGIGFVKSSASSTRNTELVTVSNGHMAQGYIKYDLEIRDADSIEFYQSDNVFNEKSFTAYLIIKNHLQYDKMSNVIAQNTTLCSSSFDSLGEKLFNCELRLATPTHGDDTQILRSLSAQPIFDKEKGAYACKIHVSFESTNFDIMNIAQQDELQFEITATLQNGVSASTNVKMIPTIIVHPLELSMEQIEQQMITITGTERIISEVHVSAPGLANFEIVPDKKGHDFRQFKLKVLKPIRPDDNAFVIINSPMTLQTIRIPIRSSEEPQKCSNTPFQSFSFITFNILSNLGLIVFTLFILAATIWGKFAFIISLVHENPNYCLYCIHYRVWYAPNMDFSCTS